MRQISSKKELSIALSRLKGFENPKVSSEQYITDSEVAADAIWNAYLAGNIKGKVIADLGSGTGILGLGCLLMGCKKVFLVESESSAMEIAKKNFESLKQMFNITENAEFILKDIADFDEKVDVVIENPPFGTKAKHADKAFLEKAMKISDKIYTIQSKLYYTNKFASKRFIPALCQAKGFKITGVKEYDLKLKATYDFHRKPVKKVKVELWVLEK